ncbi:chymotrypsin A-like [Tachypleus tridentatus]|uniref:chymotrypsin A-like n=1 Tax=Tachypleus tridentatus TaxID=6853 RepID=UPI003FD69573
MAYSNMVYLGLLFYLTTLALVTLLSAQGDKKNRGNLNSFQCSCVEYWQCISAGGKPYSYCAHSNKICCFIDPNAQMVGILPRPNKIANCGEKGVDNGREGFAEPGEWSWHAALLEKPRDVYVCGASLLDEYWVLTAAHCVDNYQTTSPLKVRLGEYDVSTTNEPLLHEEFDVEKIVIYPQFDNASLTHDIALIRLVKPAKKKLNINTVCMPDRNFSDEELLSNNRCFITGWGKRREDSDHSLLLKEVNVPLWKHKDCERVLRKQFGPNFTLPNTAICAGTEGRDACDGDGGGPLSCEEKGHWYQIGIVSFGIGCGRPNMPGVYTRVGSYRNWIHEVVLN